MNTDSLNTGMDVQPDSAEMHTLVQSGFTPEEISSLLQLRERYQHGGSDRVDVVRHWEFLKFLVSTGRL